MTAVEGHASISNEVLCRYAADAALEVPGVAGTSKRRAVKVEFDCANATVELHVIVDWGTSIPALGRAVQQRVREYLARMADVRAARVDVVVDEIA